MKPVKNETAAHETSVKSFRRSSYDSQDCLKIVRMISCDQSERS